MKWVAVLLCASIANAQMPLGGITAAGGATGIVFKQAVGKQCNPSAATNVCDPFTPLSSTSKIFLGCNAQNNTGSGPTLNSVVDGANGTYTLVDHISTTGNYSHTYTHWIQNTTTSPITVTLAWSAGTGDVACTFLELANTNAAPIGTVAKGALESGTATDILSTGNVTASAGDLIWIVGGNYYGTGGLFAVGATNPTTPAPTLRAQINNTTGNGNAMVATSLLTSSYAAKVSINVGASVNDYGNVIGVQIKQ